MTPNERQYPKLIDFSIKIRISKGAGVGIEEMNKLVKQFEQMNKMMKMMQSGKKSNLLNMFKKWARY